MAKTEDKDEKTPRKPSSKMDRFLWYLVIILAVFVASTHLARRLDSPWQEVLGVVQLACPFLAVGLFFVTFPHPIRALGRSVVRQRTDLKREEKKKRKKRRGF